MMKKFLTLEELKVAQEVINIGLSGAAKAFSSIAGGEITINSHEISIDGVNDHTPFIFQKGENVHVLLTKVMGEIEGSCYLLFSEVEVENLLDASLPSSMAEPHKRKMMADAFLMEIDNIISASVITQFSNIMNKHLYGDVPVLLKMSQPKVRDYIAKFKSEEDHLLLFKTRFEANHINMNPEFIWLMKKQFADGIKEIVRQNNGREKLKELKLTNN